GQAARYVEKPAIDGDVTQAAADRSEPWKLPFVRERHGATARGARKKVGEYWSRDHSGGRGCTRRSPSVGVLRTRDLNIAFQTVNPRAGLPIVPSLQADKSSINFWTVSRGWVEDDLAAAGIPVAPCVASVHTDVKAGPVVRSWRGRHRRFPRQVG